MTCADCHLARTNAEGDGSHTVPDHSFNVKLDTCAGCHAFQMHDSPTADPAEATPTPPESLGAVETAGISVDPAPVSPVGFSVIAGMIGLGVGIVLAPWLERWYRRLNRDGE